MNALLVLRPAKLWAFNFGHPCPPSKKGRWIDGKAQAIFLQRFCAIYPTLEIVKSICRQDGRDCECPEVFMTALLSTSIPSVTARNCFIIIRVRLSEYCTTSEKLISAVPPPLFRGEASGIAICLTFCTI